MNANPQMGKTVPRTLLISGTAILNYVVHLALGAGPKEFAPNPILTLKTGALSTQHVPGLKS